MSKKALWAGLALAAGTLAAATTAVLLAAPRAGSPDEGGSMASGTWSIEPADWKPERAASGPMVQLTLSGRSGHGHWNSSMPITLGELRGLGAEQMKGAAGAVNFQIVRDAGTISCDGTFRDGTGAGHFTFAGNPEYLAAVRAMGYPAPDSGQLFSLALHDVSRAFIKELSDLGYPRLPFDDLVSFRIHGVSADMVRDLQALGYRHPEPDGLVSLRIHGATPGFVRELKELGYDPPPSLDDLVSMRIHGVSGEMVRDLQQLGYGQVAVDDLVSMRIHGQD